MALSEELFFDLSHSTTTPQHLCHAASLTNFEKVQVYPARK